MVATISNNNSEKNYQETFAYCEACGVVRLLAVLFAMYKRQAASVRKVFESLKLQTILHALRVSAGRRRGCSTT